MASYIYSSALYPCTADGRKGVFVGARTHLYAHTYAYSYASPTNGLIRDQGTRVVVLLRVQIVSLDPSPESYAVTTTKTTIIQPISFGLKTPNYRKAAQ